MPARGPLAITGAILLAALAAAAPADACGPVGYVAGYPVAPCPPAVFVPPPVVYSPYVPYGYPYPYGPYAYVPYAWAPYVAPLPGIAYGYRGWRWRSRWDRWYDRPRIEGYTLR